MSWAISVNGVCSACARRSFHDYLGVGEQPTLNHFPPGWLVGIREVGPESLTKGYFCFCPACQEMESPYTKKMISENLQAAVRVWRVPK